MYDQVTTRLWRPPSPRLRWTSALRSFSEGGRGGLTAFLLLAGLALAGGCDVAPGEATVEAPDAHIEGAHAGHGHEPATAVPEKKETAAEPVEKKAIPAGPVAITDAGFAEAIGSGVVLVDFWAPWCSWCRRLAPVIDKLAADYDGRAVVAKLNTDENRDSPARYGVRGLPTVVVFRDGKEFARLAGYRPEKDLRAVLDKALKAE